MFAVFVVAICSLVFAEQPKQPTPFPVAPDLSLSVPRNNGDPVFVDACRGIGQAIALHEAAAGSRVVCTTRNIHSFKERSRIANTTIQLWELDYTIPEHALLIGVKFELVFGRRPVRAYFAAQWTFSGLWQSFNRSTGHYVFDMAISGPYELQNYWTRRDHNSAKMVITSISTFESWVPLIGLMAGYTFHNMERLLLTRAMGVQQLYKNTEYLITFCVLTNTSLMFTSANPTAQVRSGTLFGPQNDYVAQQFQDVATELGLTVGISPSYVGLGAVQVATMRAHFQNDTIYDCSGNYSARYGVMQQYAMFSLPGKVFNDVYYQSILHGFGIDCRNHIRPANATTHHKRSVLDLKLFRAADDIMAQSQYAQYRPRYEAAKMLYSSR